MWTKISAVEGILYPVTINQTMFLPVSIIMILFEIIFGLKMFKAVWFVFAGVLDMDNDTAQL